MNNDPLIQAAVDIRLRAYAPYSRFLVGAAVETTDGQIYSGCNVENAAYPEATCAEAGAIAAMVAQGGRHIRRVAISGGVDTACPPCGGCRQKIREFASPDTPVTMASPTGEILLVRTLAELLPDSFGPDNLA
ncbi:MULTISPECIES: cytidine deaminase [Komagataeibacter]|uniref:Cytidine deaminase n=4 Tax=Komagataeibacter TaxID=1434011 RepID=A0A0D6Q414_KOMXY|nr:MULTISPECIES: cytidine deaminase [Komagataeibacter]KPH87061.1 cytidine deaminase [Komagataeibacter intermedius AF2]MBL7232833.1 cytidine deaminase [Komagataeibacter oboediens]MBT0675576.1 cytidine deaminase [Komagataeibacter oboediens]MBT0679069.1 cytidine deaminase [Komagataeibacter oboediens]MBV1823310.1 cytidine deaminase [Komagataeibacter oboediens]